MASGNRSENALLSEPIFGQMPQYLVEVGFLMNDRTSGYRAAAALAPLLAMLLAGASAAGAASKVTVYWGGLTVVTGKTVSIVMPGGAIITGKAKGLEPDALVVEVTGTTDRRAYPKGVLRVPRTSLRVLEVKTKGSLGRIVGTVLGTAAGGVAGAYAVIGLVWNSPSAQAAPALAGIGCVTGGMVAGFLVGNAVDTHSTTIEIAP